MEHCAPTAIIVDTENFRSWDTLWTPPPQKKNNKQIKNNDGEKKKRRKKLCPQDSKMKGKRKGKKLQTELCPPAQQ